MKLPSMQCQSPEGNRLWGSSYHTTTNGQVGVITHQTIPYANAGWEEKKLAIVKDKRYSDCYLSRKCNRRRVDAKIDSVGLIYTIEKQSHKLVK